MVKAGGCLGSRTGAGGAALVDTGRLSREAGSPGSVSEPPSGKALGSGVSVFPDGPAAARSA